MQPEHRGWLPGALQEAEEDLHMPQDKVSRRMPWVGGRCY